jgi:hypothetical protein
MKKGVNSAAEIRVQPVIRRGKLPDQSDSGQVGFSVSVSGALKKIRAVGEHRAIIDLLHLIVKYRCIIVRRSHRHHPRRLIPPQFDAQ